jgi:hypothetical protein
MNFQHCQPEIETRRITKYIFLVRDFFGARPTININYMFLCFGMTGRAARHLSELTRITCSRALSRSRLPGPSGVVHRLAAHPENADICYFLAATGRI